MARTAGTIASLARGYAGQGRDAVRRQAAQARAEQKAPYGGRPADHGVAEQTLKTGQEGDLQYQVGQADGEKVCRGGCAARRATDVGSKSEGRKDEHPTGQGHEGGGSQHKEKGQFRSQ